MESINLNIIPNGTTPVCYASQFDVERKIRINLFEDTEPYKLTGNETISFHARKPDQNVVTMTLTNTADDYIEFETTEQMTAIFGDVLCDIAISYDTKTIATLNFILKVEIDPLYRGIQSESEIENLQAQVNNAVAEAVAGQYDSSSVIFDTEPTLNNDVPYTVTSDGIKRALDLKANLSALKAENIEYSNTSSGLLAVDVQEAIDELKTDIPSIPTTYAADDITYDNTDSGLVANTAQDAIDELNEDIEDLTASDVGYNNSVSGLAATTTQGAIDELKGDIDDLPSVTTYSSLNTTDKTIIGAINELDAGGGGGGNANVIECSQSQYDAWKAGGQLQRETTYIITDAVNLNGTASDLSFDGTSRTTKQAVDANTSAIGANTSNIGDLSSLTTSDSSSLVGAINEVNGKGYNDLSGRPIRYYTVNSSNPVTIQGQLTAGYATFIIIGFAEGLGGVVLAIEMAGGNLSKVINLLNGQNFSSTHLSFSGSNSQLTISADLQANVMVFG